MFRRMLLTTMLALAVVPLSAPVAHATPPVVVVHSETVQVGPYILRAGFSEWPLRSERSLDFLFAPVDGIEGHRGTLRTVRPGAEATSTDDVRLARHPRSRQQWGLDIYALSGEGAWRFEFTVDGPRGRGAGTLVIPVGARPGPPAELSWAVGLLPLGLMTIVVLVLWARLRPGRWEETWTWD